MRFQIVGKHRSKKSSWSPLFRDKRTYKTESYARRVMRENTVYYPEFLFKVEAIEQAEHACRYCGSIIKPTRPAVGEQEGYARKYNQSNW